MKWFTMVLLALVAPVICAGHPAQGIAVDSQGVVFFLDTGDGVWRLDTSGALSKVPGSAFHWLTLDRTKQLSGISLPVIPEGGATLSRTDYDLILSSDFPITTDTDGALYYPRVEKNQLRIFRLDPNGSTSTIGSVSADREGRPVKWINGSVVGHDGTFYYTETHGVWKITPHHEPIAVYDAPKADCNSTPDIGFDFGETFRGIDIDPDNNLWVAATACRAVFKISSEGKVTTMVKTTGAWSPTGIAAFGKSVYVLEYFHTASHRRREWIPRIRKISADGSHAVIAAVER